MKIIFAGTPPFAADQLQALLSSSHQIVAVLTQPDRPAGRGRQLKSSAVKQLAQQKNLMVYQPQCFNDEVKQQLSKLNADLMIVVAYGIILPAPALILTRFGCINIHASLLPRWRGAAPIQRAIQAGDRTTGITIMKMDAGLDTGDILLQDTCPITDTDTSAALHHKLSAIGARLLLHTLDQWSTLSPQKQNEQQAIYAHKIKKSEAIIDWQQDARSIVRQICAFNPWPIASTTLNNETIRVWSAKLLENSSVTANSGTIISASEQGIDVAAKQGTLRLTNLQFSGGKALMVKDLWNSKRELFQGKHPFV